MIFTRAAFVLFSATLSQGITHNVVGAKDAICGCPAANSGAQLLACVTAAAVQAKNCTSFTLVDTATFAQAELCGTVANAIATHLTDNPLVQSNALNLARSLASTQIAATGTTTSCNLKSIQYSTDAYGGDCKFASNVQYKTIDKISGVTTLPAANSLAITLASPAIDLGASSYVIFTYDAACNLTAPDSANINTFNLVTNYTYSQASAAAAGIRGAVVAAAAAIAIVATIL